MMSFGPLISYITSFLLPAIIFLVIAIVKKKKEWYAVSISCFGCALAFAISLFSCLLGGLTSFDGGISFASVLIFLGFVPVLILALVKRKRVFAVSSIVLSVALSMAAIAPITILGSNISRKTRERHWNKQQASNQISEVIPAASVPSAYDEEFLDWCLDYGMGGEFPQGKDGPMYVRAYPQTLVQDANLVESLNATQSEHPNIIQFCGGLYYRTTATPANGNTYFNNGEKIISGMNYYFKIERIQWRIMESHDGISYAMSEKIIDAAAFSQNLWDCMNYVPDSELDPYGKEGPSFNDLNDILEIEDIYNFAANAAKEMYPQEEPYYQTDFPVSWTFENGQFSHNLNANFVTRNDVYGKYCLPSFCDAFDAGEVYNDKVSITDYALARGAVIHAEDKTYPYWIRTVGNGETPVAYPYEPLELNDVRGIRPVSVWPTGLGL